ncbi:MAG: hypothetical protein ACM3ZC_12020 [Bacteroidota bacterium]
MERILADLVCESAFIVRRDVLCFAGGAFKVNNLAGEPLFYVRIALSFRGDLHFLDGANKEHNLMIASPRRILDSLAPYDLVDVGRNERVGSIQRIPRRRAWTVFDRTEREAGVVLSHRKGLTLSATCRESPGSIEVCRLKYHFNPLVPTATAEFLPGGQTDMDRRLSVASVLLICAISGI